MSPLRPPRRLTPALMLQQRLIPLPNHAAVVAAAVAARAAVAVAGAGAAARALPRLRASVLQPSAARLRVSVRPRRRAASIRCC